jgi:hypothetical protein
VNCEEESDEFAKKMRLIHIIAMYSVKKKVHPKEQYQDHFWEMA